MHHQVSRRTVISGLGSAAVLSLAAPPAVSAKVAPSAPVAVGRCSAYRNEELLPALEKIFDQIGGLGRLVKGKTVAIKLNLNGGPNRRLGWLPLEDTHWPHPRLLGVAMQLMTNAGAVRIRLLESADAPSTAPLEDNFMEGGWDWRLLLGTAPKIEFENTNFLGTGKKWSRLYVPGGGLLFPAYELNHSYADCDVFVSIAKPKDHGTTGVTLGMKNVFGITPTALYGSGVGIDKDNEVSERPRNGRMDIVHYGKRQPSNLALPELDPNSTRDDQSRVPRAIVDLNLARPVHLTIIDGVTSMAGGQGAGRFNDFVKPGVILAGTNAVCTDAVTMALMNYDPMADKGSVPFGPADNMLRIGEERGIGTRDLRRIEVLGTQIREAVCDYKALRVKRDQRRGALGAGQRSRV